MSSANTRRERRRSRRSRVEVRCWIMGSQSALYTKIRNLSRGGLAVRGPVPFKQGDEVSVRIISGEPRGDLIARSRIIWCEEEGSSIRGMGAEFLEITSGEQLLDQLLVEE